jgi:hypothetical protein
MECLGFENTFADGSYERIILRHSIRTVIERYVKYTF